MEILHSRSALKIALDNARQGNKTVGFIPTMGALHKGHLSLLKIASELTDIVVCSIFVNPTQFNSQTDLERYPRPIETDTNLLKDSKCDFLFLPGVSEMYPDNDDKWEFDVGYLGTILEGAFRAGHYQGVTQIVKKLLDAVDPEYMFLGQKDYQQVMVLEYMVNTLHMPVKLAMCPIVREEDGLALSSRNIHLSAKERKQALALFKTLNIVKHDFNQKEINALKSDAWNSLLHAEGVIPEYFEICDAETLLPVESSDTKGIVALVAAKVGKTRLIDNIILK